MSYAESVLAVGRPGAMMRRVVRRSIPFVQAALIGTLAAAALAGFAMLISHT
ncbi:MAG: hypothetical protein ACLPX7_28210 [Xanthobacteraceae bacterium]